MWVSGVNAFTRVGFIIGTLMLNSCLNISDAGTVTADYKIMTPLLQSNIIRGNGATQITLDDNVISTGDLNSVKSWSRITGNINLLDNTANYIYIYIYILE